MKLIIIEGTDNTGKNTIIYKLLEKFNVVKIIHCTKPQATNKEEAQFEQSNYFVGLVFDNLNDYTNASTDAVIHNRSWYGEYVYGCMYRNNDEAWVKDMVAHMEQYLKERMTDDDIVLLTFLADNPEFLVRNDDGLSLSQAKMDKIAEETRRFEEIHNFSSIKNKHIIWVNNGTEFRNKDEIWNEVESYIDNK